MRITSAIKRFIRRKRDSKRELQRPARARLYIDGHFLGEVESFKLSVRDWNTIVDALENPPPPSEAMTAAARWYEVVMGEDRVREFDDVEDIEEEDGDAMVAYMINTYEESVADCDDLKCTGYCPDGECECPELVDEINYDSEEYGGEADEEDGEMDEDIDDRNYLTLRAGY